MILNFVSNFSYIMPTETNRDFIRLIKYGERVTRKRTLENPNELIRTNMTPDEGNLPTNLPTIWLT